MVFDHCNVVSKIENEQVRPNLTDVLDHKVSEGAHSARLESEYHL